MRSLSLLLTALSCQLTLLACQRGLKLALPILQAACRQFIREEASPSTAFLISAISALKLTAL